MLQYHFRTAEGSNIGPINAGEFQLRRDAGEIHDQTMVWRSGMIDWAKYATVRAREKESPALPVPVAKEDASHAPVPAEKRIPCITCGQDWPESLLILREGKRICGNCCHRQRGDYERNQLKNGTGVSSGWGSLPLKCVAFAILLGGLMFLHSWLTPNVTLTPSSAHSRAK
jgi:hypothetical protein